MKIFKRLENKFKKNISSNKKLANYSWFNLGGPAEFFFKPENTKQLIEFLKDNRKNKLKITILGAGSNTLVREKGVKGVVIKLGTKFSKIQLVEQNTILAGDAALDSKISNFAMDRDSHFVPPSLKRISALLSSPVPSKFKFIPSPNLL